MYKWYIFNKNCINVYLQNLLKMDVKKEVDEVSSVFSQHVNEVSSILSFI